MDTKWLIGLVALYFLLDQFALTVETTDNSINSLLKLPKQVSLKDIIFNPGHDQNKFVKIYLSRVNEKYLL